MSQLPQAVAEAWENHEGPAVFVTAAPDGEPNAIYVTCVRRYGEDRFAIADNYFNKTRANIHAGSRGSLLFITKDRKAYQIKGTVEYQESGEIRDFLRDCLDAKYPVHAAAVLRVEAIFSGSEKIL